MNSSNILMIIAILPVLLLLYYVYKKDPHKETFGNLIKIFVFGFVSTIPIGLLEIIFELIIHLDKKNYITLFIYVFMGIALIEEFAKWIIIKLSVYNTFRFDEYYDSIVYCTFVSLGFACLENISYVISNGIGTGILRAVTSVPGHTCFGIIMGYYLCYTKFHEIRNNKSYKKYNYLSLLLPVLSHTLYDYFLFTGLIGIWIISYIILVVYCMKIINKVATQNKPFYETAENQVPSTMVYCPSCGTPSTTGGYCVKCGNKLPN